MHASVAQVAVDGVGRCLGLHVAVGVDGSPAANPVLAFGFSYASEHRQPLAAVAVTRHTDSDVWFDDRMLETHLGGDLESAVMLAREVEPWQHKFPGVQIRRAVVAGTPADGLRRCAQGAAVLVVGTAGIGPSPLGSVSRRYLKLPHVQWPSSEPQLDRGTGVQMAPLLHTGDRAAPASSPPSPARLDGPRV